MTRRHTLVVALLALAFVQLLHLLDALRYSPNATLPGVFNDPAALFGVGAALVSAIAVARDEPIARVLAIATGAAVALGFTVYHGIPVQLRHNNPYWGADGHADALRWLTVLLATGLAIWVIVLASRLVSHPRDSMQPCAQSAKE
jgi:hypothetical protein